MQSTIGKTQYIKVMAKNTGLSSNPRSPLPSQGHIFFNFFVPQIPYLYGTTTHLILESYYGKLNKLIEVKHSEKYLISSTNVTVTQNQAQIILRLTEK